jgi:hypothetical protein
MSKIFGLSAKLIEENALHRNTNKNMRIDNIKSDALS